jgi:galactokinase
MDTLSDAIRTGFRQHFGTDSGWIAVAPGRVNLIGDHTDGNDGFALPFARPRYVVIAAMQMPQP